MREREREREEAKGEWVCFLSLEECISRVCSRSESQTGVKEKEKQTKRNEKEKKNEAIQLITLSQT